MMKNFEEFQSVGKDNMDAMVASATALTKGYQTIAGEFADIAKKAFEDSSAAFEKALATKSVEGAVDVQSRFAKEAYENYVARMTKVGELYVETAKDAYKPIESRVNEFAGKTEAAKKVV